MVKINHKIRYQDIVKGIGAGLCLLDKDFRIIWINKYESDWFGTSREICGKYCYRIFQHSNHICRGCPALKVFKTAKIHQANRIAITKDGQKRYYQLTVSPIKDNRNQVAFALELVQDITDKVIQERCNSKIIHKLKGMYQHLSLVNKNLRHNMQRLKAITERMRRFKFLLNKKYHKKTDELMSLKVELQDIFKVNHALSSTIDLEKVSSLITRFTCELTHADACILRLLDEQRNSLVVNSTYGISNSLTKQLPILKVGESICGRTAKLKKPLIVYDIDKDPKVKNPQLLKKYGYKSILCIPVILQNKTLGVLSMFSNKPRHFCEEEMKLSEIFASQAAIAIEESKHYQDIHKNYFDTIHALVLALEARDVYTRGHTERVTRYSLEVARALKISKTELEILRYSAEVHDVGKISIPDFILNKPGRLTPAEKAIIELHPVKGQEMLEPLEFLRPAMSVVRHHHERYDGTGYPDGLEKEKIPFMARIIACADAFDAMTSERPYRSRKLSVEEALAEIKNNSGSQFDPHIAHSFIQIIRSKIR